MFDRVIATDASEKQITNAQPHKKVEYRVAPAENSGVESATLDLVMVAQALHWFDLDSFYGEVLRVLKDKGVFATSAYNLLQIEPAIDQVVNRYYYDVVGPFWPPERKLVEQFADLSFPFHEIDSPKFVMTANWNLFHLLGYLRTWSSTQRFNRTASGRYVMRPVSFACSIWVAIEIPFLSFGSSLPSAGLTPASNPV